jgi:hypothetical protein
MSKHHVGFLPSDGAEYDHSADDIRGPDTPRDIAPPADTSGLIAATDRAQLERDIAAIERASAALRRAEPELETWNNPPPATLQKPRPIWLLVGVLWLSTAIVTIGAVFAISALVG